jgi:hypothetical protein
MDARKDAALLLSAGQPALPVHASSTKQGTKISTSMSLSSRWVGLLLEQDTSFMGFSIQWPVVA